MKVYILVYVENSDYRCGSDIEVYLDPAKARVDMAAQYELQVKAAGMTSSEFKPDDYCYCELNEMNASVVDGEDSFVWRIEEKDLDVPVIIHLHGGLVQTIYTTADGLCPVVYDTDSDSADAQEEIGEILKELEKIEQDPNWKQVH